ncbi:MAG TPA: sulfatase-like hydrolase/transferase, partial [Pirellulaceae bacterium]|nr:sulfatase-like hydrolase/transferase [Pirellulaceae bacterium]
FNNFCAMSVCSPTRLSIATGQNAARHRTTNWINPDSDNRGPEGPIDWNWRGLKKGDVTLAGVLRDRGYRTIHVGKGHFGPRRSEGADPLNLGFDVNIGGASIGAPASYYGKAFYGNAGGNDGKIKESAPAAVPHLEKYHGTDTFLTDALTLEANAAIGESVRAGKPFFLNFAHYAVHAPFNSDPRFAGNYRESGKSPQAQAFATLVEGMDKSLGDLLDHLQKLGVAEETLIFFLGDNGSDAPLGHEHAVACAAPLRGKKGAHYEGGMRVPFIASWGKPDPKSVLQRRVPIAAGAIQSQQAAVHDLFPTILAAADATAPSGHAIDGLPLATLLSGRADTSRGERFLMHYPHSPHRSNYFTVYRDGPWKAIYHYFPSAASENSHYQLFNLADDPFEQANLAKSHPAELKRMLTALAESLVAHGALYPKSKDGRELKPELP